MIPSAGPCGEQGERSAPTHYLRTTHLGGRKDNKQVGGGLLPLSHVTVRMYMCRMCEVSWVQRPMHSISAVRIVSNIHP